MFGICCPSLPEDSAPPRGVEGAGGAGSPVMQGGCPGRRGEMASYLHPGQKCEEHKRDRGLAPGTQTACWNGLDS